MGRPIYHAPGDNVMMPAQPDTLQARFWTVAALVLVGAGAGAMLVLARDAPRVEPRTITPRGSLPAAEQALVEMFQNAAPSVAYITTEVLQPTGFFTATVAKGAGSGFVLDGDGHVVTNNHVVEGARSVYVQHVVVGHHMPVAVPHEATTGAFGDRRGEEAGRLQDLGGDVGHRRGGVLEHFHQRLL